MLLALSCVNIGKKHHWQRKIELNMKRTFSNILCLKIKHSKRMYMVYVLFMNENALQRHTISKCSDSATRNQLIIILNIQ